MYFRQKRNHILSPKTIKIKKSSYSLRKKENMVSSVCTLWESVFKISVMPGWVYSGNHPSEEKQSKSLSKLRENLWCLGSPVVSPSSAYQSTPSPRMGLPLLCTFSNMFTSKRGFRNLWKSCENWAACNKRGFCVFQEEFPLKWPLRDTKISMVRHGTNAWLGRLQR